jgi:hypothetical protein
MFNTSAPQIENSLVRDSKVALRPVPSQLRHGFVDERSSKGNESESSTLLAPAAEDYAALLSRSSSAFRPPRSGRRWPSTANSCSCTADRRQIARASGTAGLGRQGNRATGPRLKAPSDMAGFSPRNLRYMRDFAAAWPTRRSCNRLLPNCPGATTCACSTRWRTGNPAVVRPCGCGARLEPGVLEHQIDTRLMSARARPSRTSPARCPPPVGPGPANAQGPRTT